MIGLDIGDARIGVAGADGLGITAQGLPTIRRRKLEDDLDELLKLIRERGATTLVVGMPKNMNGSIGPQGEKVRAFVDALLARAEGQDRSEKPDGLNVIYWDERLTTVAANRTLLEADLSRKKRKAAVDKLSAVLILQGYLEYASHRKSEGV
ncbi:MAG: Holliday junction resolvase RuvX [Clostridiales bacterium]|nr:Holliday junction resolvase RuvX [Clostridiales bacterium]